MQPSAHSGSLNGEAPRQVYNRYQRGMKSNVARRHKVNNPVQLAARWVSVRQIPDDCLTNRIFGFDYDLWRYWIPLPFDGNPILTLPDVVASAVTISVRATQYPFGGSHSLKPLTYCRRNVIELPPIHCSASRANCTEHERSYEGFSFAISKCRTPQRVPAERGIPERRLRRLAVCRRGHRCFKPAGEGEDAHAILAPLLSINSPM